MNIPPADVTYRIGHLAGAASGRTEKAAPAFYSVTPPLTFHQADNRSGFDGLPPEGTSAERMGVSYEALREWQSILHERYIYGS